MSSPFILVIFGATGDLARHKLIPALYALFKADELPESFFIVGFARREFSDTAFQELLGEEISEKSEWEHFAKHIYYQQGVFNEVEGYEALIDRLTSFDAKMGACIMRLFYLATPPDYYNLILDKLHTTKLSEGCGPYIDSTIESAFHDADREEKKQAIAKWTRIAIEKPFGKNLEEAKALDAKLAHIFNERQIYRVDHYLGKETVQNILTFRFANSIFEPVWNSTHIDHVQITFAEKKGVAGRGLFFDGVGILRDVAQNHLMQLIAAVAMEQPKSFSREDVRDARAAAIQAIRCIQPQEVSQYVVRGQAEGYRKEDHVDPHSQTESFVALKLFVDTPRFQDVPFYLRAGKYMPEDVVEISVVFRQTCHILFKEYGCPEIGNVLTIRIQPNEGISLRMIAKIPGAHLQLDSVDMTFRYHEKFGGKGIDAYEKLLLDIFGQDQMLFNRSDELSSSWEFIGNILQGWENSDDLAIYTPGSWGPHKAKELIEQDGRKWLNTSDLQRA